MWERLQEALDWEPLPCRGELGSEDPSASKQHPQQGQNSLVCHPFLPTKWGSRVEQGHVSSQPSESQQSQGCASRQKLWLPSGAEMAVCTHHLDGFCTPTLHQSVRIELFYLSRNPVTLKMKKEHIEGEELT